MAGGTVIIAGGGTGGHLYPGIAIAQEFGARRPEIEIVFAGAGLSLEREILGRHGYRLLAIRSGGVVGKSIVGRIRGGFRALFGFTQSLKVVIGMKPRIVIGVGGYASGPMVLAAATLRVPTMIHEQNYYPGLTNRILAPWVRKVAVSFDETIKLLRGRGEVTGNPIRAEFRGFVRESDNEHFHVLIFGGSQGARAVNSALINALPHLRDERSSLRFLHGTGASDHVRVAEAYRSGGFEAVVLPYITDILEAYRQADLVIARAGASTISEIAACGTASILVPLPTAAHDHQRFNARKLEKTGAAILQEERTLTGEVLARLILSLHTDAGRRAAMERAAASLGRPDAAAHIVDIAEDFLT